MSDGLKSRTRQRGRDAAPLSVYTLKIDGRDVSGREDETILIVARQNDIQIPTLCHLEGLSQRGACRLCLVSVEGTARLLPACITRVRQDMVITTTSERIDAYRRKILELIFSERNHVCSVCVSNGHCELQSLAASLGISHVTYPYVYPRCAVDASHPHFSMDHNRCILCLRCVRVCDEIEGAHTWDVMGRGSDSRVITDLCDPWAEASSCTGCGKCVQVCPTGALTEKTQTTMARTRRRQFLPHLRMMRDENHE
ncbi:MAG: bidirectional hydrogenase complex protein HoxU [Pseudomonadota bacterium]